MLMQRRGLWSGVSGQCLDPVADLDDCSDALQMPIALTFKPVVEQRVQCAVEASGSGDGVKQDGIVGGGQQEVDGVRHGVSGLCHLKCSAAGSRTVSSYRMTASAALGVWGGWRPLDAIPPSCCRASLSCFFQQLKKRLPGEGPCFSVSL